MNADDHVELGAAGRASAPCAPNPEQESPEVTGPALALLEISDVPAGFLALDALAKEAAVEVISAGTVQSGHFLIAFAGEVEPVEMSFARALDSAEKRGETNERASAGSPFKSTSTLAAST